MTETSQSNPYASPTETDSPVASPAPKPVAGRRLLLSMLAFCAALCVAVVAAACWELLTMSADDYGTHRPVFRRVYWITCIQAFGLTIASIVAWFLLHRHHRHGRAVALCAIVADLFWFTMV